MNNRQRPGSPIIPRNKADPTQSYRPVNRMFRDIENRYYQIKLELKQLLDAYLVGRERSGNSLYGYILAREGSKPDTLYQVNAGTFIYDMSPQQLSDLLLRVETILDDYLLEGGNNNLWALQYVSDEYQRGTLQAFTNLSAQSAVYEQSTTLQQLLSSPAYQNQVAAAYISTYSEWRGITDAARADLSNIVADAIGRGVNPRETASLISKRLDISMGRAKTIAQTEQVGALREAQWNETEWSAERLGLKTGLLHLSALKPTTRQTHAFWHGKVRTVAEVREWYSINGNRYHCYCSQIPVLLNEDGSLFNTGLAEKLKKERVAWLS
ncbi:TPA: phage head morphogenesis protein [Cronobacter sakazakii]|uniref:phage minor head protein n=1 Tax=Cronobacter sakazakii TaxID=28141 RepID=UPI001375E808|nr:phage minor head protein [Cronobacter sakazakii]NCH11513.1 phage head morphogenesis protein [Cronobacter sakazakii]HDK7240456.1 phage head morphogenesis protein [Cronobacter sakazakii]HDK7256609.1 phage head morphogenesis protein [Cronobacter sakazakii]HDK7326792.1 phage head morphogenesis protein [Cronobacter sakazakii]HDK7381453.1 phage head morphogenesis protein [Cronobacter sakazakii]